MSGHAAITVLGSPEELKRKWQESEYRPGYIEDAEAAVSFKEAPGDRGTEIHVDLEQGGKLSQALKKLAGSEPKSKVMDDLRRFKQHVETGVIARSDGTPEGELAERKLKQRPAQPLSEDEAQKAGVR